jgi:hypothetical protein
MPNTELQWQTIAGKRFLKFDFIGHLSAIEAAPAIVEWRRQFESDVAIGNKVNIIWNCLKMTGFDPNVKNTWQKTLKEQSKKIEDIWIISKNPMIRVAALTMGAFTNYKIKTAVDESDIK